MAAKSESPALKALKKLRRKGKNSASAKLATLVVDDLLGRPARELFDSDELADRSMELLAGLAQAGELEELIEARLHRWLQHMEDERGTLGDWVPGEAAGRLRDVVAASHGLDADQTLRWIDHDAMRDLVRRVLRETLSSFVKRLRSPVSESRILSSVKRRAGRFAKRPRALVGGLGDGMMGAVSDEMERQMQRRVGDFVDSAVGSVLRRIAEHVSDPSHQAQYGKMRAAMLDLTLQTSSRAAARTLAKADLDAVAAYVRAEIVGLRDSDLLRQRIVDMIEDELDDAPTLGDWLAHRNLLDPWRDWALTELATHTRELAETEAFEAWFTALLE